ncbi:response regulator [Pararhizobium sp. DWP1-1-3]|uniref:response regulator n=1 Tax=Pararhizobium sp. DWP1-1-3 TaxID=2804652 RepID=UPI003CE6B8C4
MAICVAFVDDHPILLEGLVSLYSLKKDLSIVAQGHHAVDAIKIAEQHSPDVIVLDLSMPGDSLAAIDIIIKTVTKTKVVIFTATSSIETAVKALNLGVFGYVLKGSTTLELHEAIIAAYNGETLYDAGLGNQSHHVDENSRDAAESHAQEQAECP